jgi:hypothetical protein
VLPVFGKGDTLFQPVYVGDVGRIVEILTRKNAVNDTDGKIIEAGGPDGKISHLKCDCDSHFINLDMLDSLTFRQIMSLVVIHTGRFLPIVSVPWKLGELKIMQRYA